MRNRAYRITTTVLPVVGLAALFALRFAGLYSHQALAAALGIGLIWAVIGPGGLAWRKQLRWRQFLVFQASGNRSLLLEAIGRSSFWVLAAVACLWVFPRSAEMWSIMAIVAGVSLLRIAASFVIPRQPNRLLALIMVLCAVVLVFDLTQALRRGPPAVVKLAVPFEGEWLVLQGGMSPLQNHHLVAFNQRFAIDVVRLENGHIFDATGEAQGNAAAHGWEQPLFSPVGGKVVFTRDDLADAEGAALVREAADAFGNMIAIQTDTRFFVVLAHLRQGTLRVKEGQVVSQGDLLAQVGNSGNTTMPHLHLQVQTHVDPWHAKNRSVPFVFGTNGRMPIRNDRIHGR